MALKKSTIKKLELIKACILQEPRLYDQNHFPGMGNDTCNTPCCLAGWAVWVNNPDPEAYNAGLKNGKFYGTAALMKALGITRDQASFLFHGNDDESPRTEAGAIAGARRIDQFIERNS